MKGPHEEIIRQIQNVGHCKEQPLGFFKMTVL